MRIRSILNGSIGNTLEWYDFGLFEIFAPSLSRLFFPNSDPHTELIMTFGLFASGYICRPFGSLLFGYYGDKYGRTLTLRYSVILIALPTLLIGLLPTYQTIGIAAPLLLMLIRIWQGFCVGGECGGNVVYLAEISSHRHRALITSFSGLGANIGYLLSLIVGTLCSYLIKEDTFLQWGWRLPYLASGVLCLVAVITRMNIQETEAFHQLQKSQMIVKNPVRVVIDKHIPDCFRVAGLLCMGIAFYYSCFVYMPTLLTEKLHYPMIQVNILMIVMTIIVVCLAPLSGILCDKIGRKILYYIVASCMMLATVPCFYFLSIPSSLFSITVILLIFTIIASLEQGVSYAAAAENFPLPARYTGVSLAYNASASFFGGMTPLICEWLIGKIHSIISPALYVIACAIITSVVVLFFLEDKRGESLGLIGISN